MIVLGLTGSIGMGKTTVARQFETLGVQAHDADAQVHEFFDPAHTVYFDIAAAFPIHSYPQIYKASEKGAPKTIDRKALGRVVFANDHDRKRLEAIIHPHVRAAQDEFKRAQQALGADIVLFDIPLLYETKAEERVDKVIVVTAPYEIQAQRVLSRAGMTQEKFESILATQMNNDEKCRRADFIIHTNLGLHESLAQCKNILRALKPKS